MDPDFTALASRVAARAEVLGCIILSRDGLVLGAFPPHGEQDITPGLLRFASLGDPDRGFAQFSDELWAYVREGSYAAFAVAEKGTRPGILLDYLEQALLVAEEARQFGQAMSEPVHVDLSHKGMRLGRKLRATTPDSEQDFRSAAIAAPAREAGDGETPRPQSPPAAGPAVDDDSLDEALAAALAVGDGQSGGAPEPDGGATADPEGPGGSPAAEAGLAPVADAVPFEVAGREQPGEVSFRPEEPGWMDPAPAAPFEPGGGDAAPDPGGYTDGGPDTAAEAPGPLDGEPAPQAPPAPANPEEIDRVALAREFAQLLQEGPGGAD